MPSQPTPQPNRLGLVFKPWPMQNFLVSLASAGVLLLGIYMLEYFTNKDTGLYPAALAGGMASTALSYLNYCGYSLFRSPPKIKMAVWFIYLGVLVFCYVVARTFVGS